MNRYNHQKTTNLGNKMRFSQLIALSTLLITSLATAAPPIGEFNQAEFEKRFKAADKTKTGRLSRQAAYAEFPRMPQYFDEIDRNKDGFITLKEVEQALDHRLETAMKASTMGKTNIAPATAPDVATPNLSNSESGSVYSSKEEAKRAQRYEYYESLAGSLQDSRLRNQPTQPQPYPTLLKKDF